MTTFLGSVNENAKDDSAVWFSEIDDDLKSDLLSGSTNLYSQRNAPSSKLRSFSVKRNAIN